MKAFYFLILSLVGFGTHAQTFESPDTPVALIELYTSEGCSSCPPADRWLSGLSDDEGLWSRFVPVAFHVDYWDHIGWKDPYASQEYSQRQRLYAREYRESTVYTPGIRKSGEEWRSWRFFGKPESTDKDSVGKVKITVSSDGGFVADYVGSVEQSTEQLQLNVAILGVDLSTKVTRGENSGKTLKHDFVVLGISRYARADTGQWKGDLPEHSVDAPRYAVAAWLTQGQSLKPIQATGGYLVQN